MGANLPAKPAETNLSRVLAQEGFKLLHRGKVRDTYELRAYPQLLLVVATDRVSVFDFVLPCLVPGKGQILVLLTVHWLTKVFGQKYAHHLVAYGERINEYLPLTIRDAPELLSRASVVRRLEMIPVEAVVRGYLVGLRARFAIKA